VDRDQKARVRSLRPVLKAEGRMVLSLYQRSPLPLIRRKKTRPSPPPPLTRALQIQSSRRRERLAGTDARAGDQFMQFMVIL